MQLHLIAAIESRGERAQIHSTFRFSAEDAGRTRVDLAVIGHSGPTEWQPGELQSGPAYHTSAVLVGGLPAVPQGFFESIASDFADVVQMKVKRVLTLAGGLTLVRFLVDVDVGGLAVMPEPIRLNGSLCSLFAGLLPQKLITDIGIELREALVHEQTGRLTNALTAPVELPPLPEPSRVVLTAEQREQMRAAGLLKPA